MPACYTDVVALRLPIVSLYLDGVAVHLGLCLDERLEQAVDDRLLAVLVRLLNVGNLLLDVLVALRLDVVVAAGVLHLSVPGLIETQVSSFGR